MHIHANLSIPAIAQNHIWGKDMKKTNTHGRTGHKICAASNPIRASIAIQSSRHA